MNKCGGLRSKGKIKASVEGKPLVSIVVPVFNGAMFLDETLRSVLSQTYENIECIVIDGGSTDDSLEIIRKYEDKLDYWLSEPDSGMYEAINKGLKMASGEILAYLNSDDLYFPDTVQIAVGFFSKHPAAELIYGNCEFINGRGEFLYIYHYPKFKWASYIVRNTSCMAQPTTFWRSLIHGKAGYFDTTFKMSSDFDFYAKVGKCCRFEHTGKVLAKYRIHNATLTETRKQRIKIENEIINKRYCCYRGIYRIYLWCKIELWIKLCNFPLMLKKAYLFLTRGSAYKIYD